MTVTSLQKQISYQSSKRPAIRTQTSFGSSKFLQTLGSNGSDAGIVTMSTSLAIMALRPLVIMMDKNATKEEKKYAASWIFGLSLVGFLAQAALKKPFDKLSLNIAKKVFKPENKEAITGMVEVIKFGLYNIAAVAYTYLNSRYIGKVINKLTHKEDKSAQNLTPEQQKKEKRKDKLILGTLIALGSFIGLNIIGRKLTGKPIASDAVAKAFRKTNEFLSTHSSLYRGFKESVKNMGSKIANFSKNKMGWFEKQGNIRDGWITRNMIANSIVRPVIALFSGQPYLAIRCFIDEGIGAGIMKFVGDPLTKMSIGPLKKLFGNPTNPQEIEGIKVLAGQLVKNVGILCIGLGILNNAMSKKVAGLLDKFKKTPPKEIEQKEEQYKELRKNFVPALAINQNTINNSSANNPNEWLNALNNSNINTEFVKFIRNRS